MGDEQTLSLVGAATFLETYAHMIPGEDLVSHCASQHSPAAYAAWLRDPNATIWIAETEAKAPIGYLLLTKATLPLDAPQPEDLEVQRIYVLSRFQRTGMGYALMKSGGLQGYFQGRAAAGAWAFTMRTPGPWRFTSARGSR